jgi:AraC-like DNA-binding protein
MKYLFEYTDTLNSPFEAFCYDTSKEKFPVEAHWHYFVEAVFMLKGSAVITYNGKTYTLNESQMMFFHSQAIHSFDKNTDEDIRYLVIQFDINKLHNIDAHTPKFNTLFRSASMDDSLPLIFTQDNFPDFDLEHFFFRCLSECDGKQYGYYYYMQHSISLFLLEILRYWKSCGFSVETESYGYDDSFSIHQILEYIDAHSHENIQVNDLAQMCHMSYSYFAKSFHKLYGQSCKSYIEFIRLNKAENYLLFTNYDLNFISSETGFSDCSHLIRIFKRKYGITPKQFRLKYKK